VPAAIYLEADDEITAAVSRIRALQQPEAVLVLSRASRIGTSRINFKLLAREAHASGVNLVAVSDEPTVRALAVSAGLPAYDSVAAAERALEQFREQDEQLVRHAGRLPGAPRPRSPAESGAAAAGQADGSAETGSGGAGAPGEPAPDLARDDSAAEPVAGQALVGPLAATAEERPAAEGTQALSPARTETRVLERPVQPPGRSQGRARRRVPVVALLMVGLLAVLVVGGLYLAYLYLPTATITLRPQTQPLGPLEVRVSADPTVAVPDAEAGVIPAEHIQLPLRVSAEFPATGIEVTREAATGSVRFRSENTLFDVPIPAGTVVSTDEGVEFVTTSSVSLGRASFASGPTTVNAPIEAVSPGPRGNVDSGAISELPEDLAAALITVTNPQPTSGGSRQEELTVTQEDFDAALESLTGLLADELQARLADPATTPRGLTIFPASLRSDEPRPVPPAGELVGTPGEEFGLSLEMTASVLAVNEALVGQVASEQLRTAVGPGRSLVGDDVATSHAAGVVLGSTVVYRASASGQVYSEPDREALLEAIRGKPISEARAILDQHGTADITLWPDVVDRLPEQVARINLTILPPREGS
jgi:hypothetical protein